MARFFVEPQQIKNDIAVINGPDVKHISKVLRMNVGDQVNILDGQGNVYQAQISEINKETVICALLGQETGTGEPLIKVTLVQGLPKGDKLETIIQKCTEIGVHRIIPLATERSVVKIEPKKALERQQRWQRIAIEAAKQCRRPAVPEVQVLSQWEQVLSNMPREALALMPWEEENNQSLRQSLQATPSPQEVFLFIGPEGGFAPGEVVRAKEGGCRMVTLGSRILRTETAGPAALAMVLYHYGELG